MVEGVASVKGRSAFDVIMIKPSRYGEDGYPITWVRSLIPANTLAVLYGLGADAKRRAVLGEDVDIVLRPYDEMSRRIRPEPIIADIRRRGGKALICLVGVQSAQFPRAVDLARPFRAAGLPVIVGGFHVSGCLSMLPELPSEIRAAMDIGISIFAGEAEDGRFDQVLKDAWVGALKPIYNYLDDLPSLEGEPTPFLPAVELKRSVDVHSSFDLGRGCPFQCSFCTIINVQGRKSRFRTADDLERIVRENYAQGISAFFVTDDNLARNRLWETYFDRLIELRENEGIELNMTIQVDAQSHRVPRFIEKARRAGISQVFIGLENVNPDNLLAAKKRQNKITEYRVMLQRWHQSGALTVAGYITGFPADTRASLLRDIEIVKRELPVDLIELFMLTPLPGSEDHRNMVLRGEWMDDDLNKFNTHQRVTHHPTMSDREWDEAQREAWDSYFSRDHIEIVARRQAALPDGRVARLVAFMTIFRLLQATERIHPLEGGLIRLKYRRDRRPGLPIELPLIFHLKLAAQFARKLVSYGRLSFAGWRIARRVMKDPARSTYSDIAIAPVAEADLDRLELFSATRGAEVAVARKRDEDRLRAKLAMRVPAAE
jgi:tRNA A37 methylthiotransferase MiaB